MSSRRMCGHWHASFLTCMAWLYCIHPCDTADKFQPSPSFQGQRRGFVFTTGQFGTGYYRDRPPKAAAAAQPSASKPSSAAPAEQPHQRSQPAAGAAPAAIQDNAAAAHLLLPAETGLQQQRPRQQQRAGAARQGAPQQQQQQQQQQQPSKVLPSLPTIKVSDPKPQLLDQGQEVGYQHPTFHVVDEGAF